MLQKNLFLNNFYEKIEIFSFLGPETIQMIKNEGVLGLENVRLEKLDFPSLGFTPWFPEVLT